MNDQSISPDQNDSLSTRSLLLFISGMGALGFLFALLLFGGEMASPATEGDSPITDLTVDRTFPLVTPAVNAVPNAGEIAAAAGIGSAAPNFVLEDLDGRQHTLTDLRGRPVIVNFWASWCAPCRIEMPELEAAYAEYADHDLEILAVNREEDPQQVHDFFYEQMDLTFIPLLDSEAKVADAYGVFNMPTTYFINTAGDITAVHRGPLTAEQIEQYLSETIASTS